MRCIGVAREMERVAELVRTGAEVRWWAEAVKTVFVGLGEEGEWNRKGMEGLRDALERMEGIVREAGTDTMEWEVYQEARVTMGLERAEDRE